MARCEVCGNDYDKAFQVTMGGEAHTFDSFECAIQALAPICSHCRCRIIGHGMEAEGNYYCCAHCAHEHDVKQVRDRPKGDDAHARETHGSTRPRGEATGEGRYHSGW